MATRALATTGTGGTTALATTQIGSDLTLPAGGPWTIFGIWGQVAKITTVPDEGTGGDLIISAVSGDLSPDPAPGTYPLIGAPSNPSANDGLSGMGLNIWPVNWQAAGKAVVRLSYRQQLAITTASATAGGIIFGDSIPTPGPLVFCDRVQTSFASATEQSVGTVTLAEKASRITGLMFVVNKGDAVTAGEAILCTFRLASDDIQMPPSQWPGAYAFNAADGTDVGSSAVPQAQFIPVDIPVQGGARVTAYATSTASVTGNVDVSAYIAYE